ncbi:MAG: hypothetical protein LBF21_01865 [Puniceicoccales bacterium]|jgi:hypothetical protein|nr:hypothetical protein [Puniceicoccales bacterium]
MNIRQNVVVVSAILRLSSSAYQLEAMSWAELQEGFAAYGTTLPGELGEQVRAIHQEIVHLAKVEAKDPWNFFETEMEKLYPFFKECTTGPAGLSFPLKVSPGTPVDSKNQWWMGRGPVLLGRLEKIKNLAETEDTGLREEFQDFLQEETAFIQAIYDENQRIHLAECEIQEGQSEQSSIQEYTASIPDDLKDVAAYWLNPKRGPLAHLIEGEMREKQLRFIKWNFNQPLIPYLPDEADREQFFETTKRVQAEAVRDLQ